MKGRGTTGGVPSGNYDIVPVDAATPNYWDPCHRLVTKQDGVHLGGQDFVLRVGGQFTVTIPVFDQNGAPLQGIILKLHEHTGRIFTAWSCETGETEFIGVWSGHSVAWPETAPAEGKKWDPPRLDVNVPDHDVTTEPFQLVPK